jgi:alpha-glucosidase
VDTPYLTRIVLVFAVAFALGAGEIIAADAPSSIVVESPGGRNTVALQAAADAEAALTWSVARDGRQLFAPAPFGPTLVDQGSLGKGAKIVAVDHSTREEEFTLPWGKTNFVQDRCALAKVTLKSAAGLSWEVELRAYDDGIAARYRIPEQEGLAEIVIADEATEFAPAEGATALHSGYDNYTSSHEAQFVQAPIGEIAAEKLLEMPLLVTWSDGPAAAITEARLLHFAGMYLQRTADRSALRSRLSPLPTRQDAAVVAKAPLASPWRVVLLADRAGQLLESNLLLCLNDPPSGDFAWALPGKTSFHWWNGAFEDDYQADPEVHLARHKKYIDFCAKHHIAYHGVSGDGRPWHVQSAPGYSPPGDDADVRKPRNEAQLREIIEYARQRGVGIRLWVHWRTLSKHLEEAFTLYESWGIKGLMVDFLDRDDQEMIEFTEQLLESAARHKMHIQIHGSSKYSGEQRTFPHLFNREGVLNLEYLKWGDLCTPDHTVNVAYVRALAGPVDYHLGGFRSVSRAEFKPRDRAPVVLGSRCHQMALYIVFENPMPMVADEPAAYEGQAGFDFVEQVPTTWEETRFVAGEVGEYVVLARRQGKTWYLAGITDWTPRKLSVPLEFLSTGRFKAHVYADGSLDDTQPNEIAIYDQDVQRDGKLDVSLAPGGGFVVVIEAR